MPFFSLVTANSAKEALDNGWPGLTGTQSHAPSALRRGIWREEVETSPGRYPCRGLKGNKAWRSYYLDVHRGREGDVPPPLIPARCFAWQPVTDMLMIQPRPGDWKR